MIGRGIATAAIWLSPIGILAAMPGGTLKLPGAVVLSYGILMCTATFIVWLGTLGDK